MGKFRVFPLDLRNEFSGRGFAFRYRFVEALSLKYDWLDYQRHKYHLWHLANTSFARYFEVILIGSVV